MAALFPLGAGMYVAHTATWATAGASAATTLAAVGTAQLLVVVRRRLR